MGGQIVPHLEVVMVEVVFEGEKGDFDEKSIINVSCKVWRFR